MIQVWMLILSLFSFTAIASEFNHIKLNPRFEEYLRRPKMKSIQGIAKSGSGFASETDYSNSIRSTLLGSSGLMKTAKGITDPFASDGEESPLYEEIRRQLEASHQSIGLREVTQLDFLNQQFNLGTQNLSGFSWQRPFGVVHVFADRQVTPNLFGSNWLIQDTFTFDIEATTFLEKTNEAGITDMSATEIGAFAGITFKRVYTYYHYADSYQEGLRADFSKLFLPFVRFNKSGVNNMLTDEIMKREDNWTASAGGLISTPPLYNVSLTAGILAEAAYQQMVSVQNNGEENIEERIRLNVKSTKTAALGSTLSLQLDVFKLIKLTLLNFDLTYEYADSKNFTLGFSPSHLQTVSEDQNQESEFKKILRGFGKVKYLEPYVVRLDESESSALAARGSILVWGKLQKSKTEQIRVIKDEAVRVFYKSYSQSMRVVQNVFSRLFSAVVYKIFKLPMGTKNAALYKRQVTLEYEATHPQAVDPNIARVEASEQFSFVITQSYEASRTDRWIDKTYKNDVIWFIDSFTTLPKDYKGIVRSEQLKGPLRVESNLRIEKSGFEFFLNKSPSNVFKEIAEVCRSSRVSDWMNESKRNIFLKSLQVGREACVKSIGKRYLSFKSDYEINALKPSIAKFKSFLTKYYKKSGKLEDLTSLFGEENTFIHGQLKATNSHGATFVTSFSSGQFRGLGVIDNFKRVNGSRMPASIISE